MGAPSRSSHPVNVVFGFFRQIVIDDIVYIRNIQAAGAHVGGDQDIAFAFSEPAKHIEFRTLLNSQFRRSIRDQPYLPEL